MKIQPDSFALQDYLGVEFECDCGHIHKTNLKEAIIGPNALEKVPELVLRMGYRKVLVVGDDNTWRAAGSRLYSDLLAAGIEAQEYVFHTDDLVPDETALGALMMKMKPSVDLLIAVGTGTLNDLCKYTSFVSKCDYFIVATAPSMDGFASIGAPLICDNLKTTFDAHTPVAIIGDRDVLAESPMDMINAGLGDILGKYTCLIDWKMANLIDDEYYCPTIVKMVECSIARVLANKEGVALRDPQAIQNIMEALVLTGIAMSFVGNSRPASGSEHHLSHYWEMRYLFGGKKPVLHGRKVAAGTTVVSHMYHRLANMDVDFNYAREKAASFDMESWTRMMEDCYRQAAPGVIALEKQTGKNNASSCIAQINSMEKKWPQICQVIREQLPEEDQIARVLRDLGAPADPCELGVDRQLMESGICVAKEVRNRFTVLQMLFDLGLLEDFAKEAGEHFYH